MSEPEFEYGPLAQGIYKAMLWFTLVIPFLWAGIFFYYIAFLIFLAFGLRPVLKVTGLYRLWASVTVASSEKWNRGWVEKQRKEVERKVRDEKYRHVRRKDSRLPRHW